MADRRWIPTSASAVYAVSGLAWAVGAGRGAFLDRPTAPLAAAIAFTLVALVAVLRGGSRPGRLRLVLIGVGCLAAVAAMPVANRLRRGRDATRAEAAARAVVGQTLPPIEWVDAIDLDPETEALVGGAGGRWLLIELAAPWLTAGLEEMRGLSAVAESVDPEALAIVAIVPLRAHDRAAEIAGLAEFKRRFLVRYPLLAAADSGDESTLGAIRLPAIVVVSPDARVAAVLQGEDALQQVLDHLRGAGAIGSGAIGEDIVAPPPAPPGAG